MKISAHGEVEQIAFGPSDEIATAFERVNAAIGKPDELPEMRLFIRTMNYFYKQASHTSVEMNQGEMNELCRLAKKGLIMELETERGPA